MPSSVPSTSNSSYSVSPYSILSPSISSSLSSNPSPSPLDQLLTSIRHLLSRALSLPCSTAAQAFTQLVQPTLRFQLALDALLPVLEASNANDHSQVAQRILASFILFSLYAPHPISINPFRSALFVTFVNEREKAVGIANSNGAVNGNIDGRDVSASEQLVWVLWKILRGDGNDIGPYTPLTLARSPLPPKLAAINLFLDDSDDNDLDFSSFTSASKAGSGSTSDTNIITNANPTTNNSSTLVTSSDDLEDAAIAHGMNLVLAARERVLSLSERRMLEPILPTLATSGIITTFDLASIVTLNPDVAYPLFVELLISSSSSSSTPSKFLDILEILPYLPPTLSAFDLMGRLLRDTRLIPIPSAIPKKISLGKLIQSQVLARFIHECIERFEREERERERTSLESGPSSGGSDGGDSWGRGVRNLCRFYLSLIKLDIVPSSNSSSARHYPSSSGTKSSAYNNNGYDYDYEYEYDSFPAESDSIEIAHFALRNSRFEEARLLYGVLATGRLDGM
ncbi:hypothetical protein BT96DRAFT_966122 [Gymnopus androsaceus JB14]|uniref:Uncharacterized protein n=1 Tax=Gymnopus androsaceus JB14 TaxID=1447944 RepID=A0A6A4HLC2_9AGAR|nr:hypothetical protein BT96DRAFT_966122 [Gymnopus androsaceus JB14]